MPFNQKGKTSRAADFVNKFDGCGNNFFIISFYKETFYIFLLKNLCTRQFYINSFLKKSAQ